MSSHLMPRPATRKTAPKSRVSGAIIVFLLAVSYNGWTGPLGAIDVAAAGVQTAPVTITVEHFDLDGLSADAFAD